MTDTPENAPEHVSTETPAPAVPAKEGVVAKAKKVWVWLQAKVSKYPGPALIVFAAIAVILAIF